MHGLCLKTPQGVMLESCSVQVFGRWGCFPSPEKCEGRVTQPEPCVRACTPGSSPDEEPNNLKSNNVQKKNTEVLRTHADLIPRERLDMSDRIFFLFFQASTLVYEGIDVATSKGTIGCVCASRGLNKLHLAVEDTASACGLYS